MFSKSKEALLNLQQILHCMKCHQESKDLLFVGRCDHWFCRSCAELNSGNPCAVCGLPSVASETRYDQQLSNVATLCSSLHDLLSGSSLRKKASSTYTKIRNDFESFSEDNATVRIEELDLSTSRSGRCRRSISKVPNRLDMNELNTPEKRSVSSVMTGCGDSMKKIKMVDVKENKNASTPQSSGKKNPKSTPQSRKKCNNNSRVDSGSKANFELSSTSPRETPSSGKKTQSIRGDKTNLLKRNAKGETRLQVATIKNDIDEVKQLLDAGANPNVKDNAGWTPLHEAIGHGNTGIASLLIANGASVNAPGMDNETPLHDAVINQHIECTRLLVVNGANVCSRNVHGETPMDLAQLEEIKTLLLKTPKTFGVSIGETNLPLLEESSKLLCITGSSLSKQQNEMMIQNSRCLQAKVVNEITPEVTHLITNVDEDGSCAQTQKYLSAILSGKWIVQLKWLDACCASDNRISEQSFQVAGCVSHPNSHAPQKAVNNRLEQLPPLFDGCQVFFYGKFNVSGLHKEHLVTLIKQGGGVVLKREPHLHNLDDYPYTHPYHAQNTKTLADCTIYVIYDDVCPNPPSVNAHRMSCLPVSWLLDSIATFSLREKTNYL